MAMNGKKIEQIERIEQIDRQTQRTKTLYEVRVRTDGLSRTIAVIEDEPDEIEVWPFTLATEWHKRMKHVTGDVYTEVISVSAAADYNDPATYLKHVN